MKTIRRLVQRASTDDSGISLVEVLVAVVVFAIVSTGVAFTILSVLNVTKESQSREEATSLASQEIDLDRSIADLFALVNSDRTYTVNGVNYYVHRATQWVSDPSVDQNCGAGGGVLRYKRVNVTVTWDGMVNTATPVRADTLIDPGTRINDPSLGTILVSIITASGTGSEGVSVTATPSTVPNGAQALAVAPAATDSQGCTYVLDVTPGNYDVKISRSGYLDVNQSGTATTTVGVVAGGAASVGFQFDQAGTFSVAYATNYSSGTPSIPTNLNTSFLSTYGTYVTNSPLVSVNLYPFTGGYSVLAGRYVDPSLASGGCASVDPTEWPAGTTLNGVTVAAGVRGASVATVPGGSTSASVSMGVLKLSGLVVGQYVTAVEVSGPNSSGDPGCSMPSTYTFAKLTVSSPTLALPYGSWKMYTGTSLGSLSSQVSTGSMTVVGNGGTDSSSGGIAILDPRLP